MTVPNRDYHLKPIVHGQVSISIKTVVNFTFLLKVDFERESLASESWSSSFSSGSDGVLREVVGAVPAIVLETSEFVDGEADGPECSDGPKYQFDWD